MKYDDLIKNKQDCPLVTCIMPTANRRAFAVNAIRFFLQQDYPNKELLIADDGQDDISDFIPGSAPIRYLKIAPGLTLGAKRNFCVLQSRGNLIMHWDDDDWMAPWRIQYQVEALLREKVSICGINKMYFCETATGKSWLYQYPANGQPWLAGGSLLYTKAFWTERKFPDIQVASDTRFVLDKPLQSYAALTDYNFYVAAIHARNTSQKDTSSKLWQSIHEQQLKKIMGNDWEAFLHLHQPGTVITHKTAVPNKRSVAILITTCRRQQQLEKLINALKEEADQFIISFFIIDDDVLQNGKKKYWQTINLLWKKAQQQPFDYYLQLPDDITPLPGFINRSVAAWNAIDDKKKICLNLLLDNHRLGKTCWTSHWPTFRQWNQQFFLQTQWVDMIYIASNRFFEQLQWQVLPVPGARWDVDPLLSSGVGQQISHRLHQQGWHLYQVTEKLVEHNQSESVMNPELRHKEPMHAISLQPVYAGMASIPGREYQLQQTVHSIAPYLNRLFVYLNDYKEVPAWLLKYPNITCFLSHKENSNKGDAGKFFGLQKIKETSFYYFTIDDDMLYPPDYVWKMIRKIEHHQRRAIVGCGGYSMKPEVKHFYYDRSNNWHFNMPNKEDRPVQVLHTCLTAWHSSAIDFSYDDCLLPNMGDIWLALAAQQQQTPMILIERPANWVGNQALPLANTIYGQFRDHCPQQTAAYNSWPDWKLIPFETTANNQPAG